MMFPMPARWILGQLLFFGVNEATPFQINFHREGGQHLRTGHRWGQTREAGGHSLAAEGAVVESQKAGQWGR